MTLKKRVLSIILAFSMIMGISITAFGQPNIAVDDKPITLERESFLGEEGILMIPLRGLLERLGYKVIWNNADWSVKLMKDDQEISLAIDSKDIYVNGEKVEMKNPPIIKANKSFIPAELLDKSLDKVLGWNSKTETLRLRDKEEKDMDLFSMSKDKETLEKLEAYMEALEKYENFHGSVLVAKEGEILLNRGYGYADFAQNIENKSQTRFAIGSVTKQFTATAILRLIQDGRLDLEDKVSEHLDGIPHGDEITIHNLLTNTSGLKNFTDTQEFLTFDTSNKDPQKLLDLIKDRDLEFKPGEMFNYSNTNYLILGMMVEKISGESFEDYLYSIVNPLGMKDTGLIYGNKGGVNDASPYSGFLEVTEIDDDLILSQAFAAGSIYSTVEDLYRWDRAIKSGKVLEEKMLNEAFKGHIAIPPHTSYGYGWMIDEGEYGKEIYHGGNTFGSTAYIGNLVDEDITVIILSNSGYFNASKLKDNLLSIVLGKEYDMPEELKEIEIEDKDLYSKYVGTYDFLNGAKLDIIEEEGNLYAQATGQEAFRIYPSSETEFFAKIADITIEFVMGEEKAKELLFKQAGIEFTSKRIEDEKEEKKEVEVDPKIYDDYVGEYKLAENIIVTITKEEDKLFAKLTGQEKAEIFPSSESEFFYKIVDAQITFEKGEDGKTTNLILHQMGRDMPAEKIK